jgi:uncharacterized membrane protein
MCNGLLITCRSIMDSPHRLSRSRSVRKLIHNCNASVDAAQYDRRKQLAEKRCHLELETAHVEKAVISVLVSVAFAQPLVTFAQQSQSPNAPQGPPWYGPGPWQMWDDGYGWPFWWIGPVMMMLFLVLICGAVIYLIFSRHPSFGGPSRLGPSHMMDRQCNPSYSALQILDERYARGEIQKEDY